MRVCYNQKSGYMCAFDPKSGKLYMNTMGVQLSYPAWGYHHGPAPEYNIVIHKRFRKA
jgi:hypothetical protein